MPPLYQYLITFCRVAIQKTFNVWDIGGQDLLHGLNLYGKPGFFRVSPLVQTFIFAYSGKT